MAKVDKQRVRDLAKLITDRIVKLNETKFSLMDGNKRNIATIEKINSSVDSLEKILSSLYDKSKYVDFDEIEREFYEELRKYDAE